MSRTNMENNIILCIDKINNLQITELYNMFIKDVPYRKNGGLTRTIRIKYILNNIQYISDKTLAEMHCYAHYNGLIGDIEQEIDALLEMNAISSL